MQPSEIEICIHAGIDPKAVRSETGPERRLLFRRRDGAGVIVNDAPAFGEALPDQGEDAADVALVLLAGQVPVAQNQRSVVADEMKLEIGEVQLPHGGAIGIDLLVSRADGFETALNPAGAGESEVGRAPICLHELVDVAFVPANLLILNELRDGSAIFSESIGRRLGTQSLCGGH